MHWQGPQGPSIRLMATRVACLLNVLRCPNSNPLFTPRRKPRFQVMGADTLLLKISSLIATTAMRSWPVLELQRYAHSSQWAADAPPLHVVLSCLLEPDIII